MIHAKIPGDATARLFNLEDIATEPEDNAFTPEHVEQTIAIASDIAVCGIDTEDSSNGYRRR